MFRLFCVIAALLLFLSSIFAADSTGIRLGRSISVPKPRIEDKAPTPIWVRADGRPYGPSQGRYMAPIIVVDTIRFNHDSLYTLNLNRVQSQVRSRTMPLSKMNILLIAAVAQNQMSGAYQLSKVTDTNVVIWSTDDHDTSLVAVTLLIQ